MEQLDLIAGVAEPSRAQQARAARDEGIKQAIDHADAVVNDWSVRAFALLVERIGQVNSGDMVTAEKVRAYAEAEGLPAPPDKRAWGGVMLRASRRGLLLKTDRVAIAEDPKVHCNPVALWEKP